MNYFENFLRTLDQWGVSDILLPFLLVFTLVYAILEKTRILGTVKVGSKNKPKSNLNTVVSLVMGLAVVIPHVTNSYPYGRDVVVIINNALPGVVAMVVGIFAFLLLLGFFTDKRPRLVQGSTVGGFTTLVLIIAVIAIFVDASGTYVLPNFLWFLRDPGVQAGIVVLAVFAGLIFFITKDDDKEPKSDERNLMQKFGDAFTGGDNDD